MRIDRREVLAILAGGFIGAVLRAELVTVWGHDPGDWPWATLVVNVVGAALLGFFLVRLQERLPLSAYRRPLLGTGLCGALTTFSAMQLEVLDMFDAGNPGLAAAYIAVSLVCGLLAVTLATHLTRRSRLMR